MARDISAFLKAAVLCGAGAFVLSGCGAHHGLHHDDGRGWGKGDKRARAEVERTVHELFIATDEKDWPRVRAVFADRVDFDVTSLVGGEPATLPAEQIVDGWREGLKDVPFIHHQIGNMQVDMRGRGEAEVFCYGMATHHNPDAEKKTTWFVGSYDLRLSRVGGEWKISAFRFNSKYVE